MSDAEYSKTGSSFLEQIKFFIEKNVIPTRKWDDIQDAMHDRGFVVAGMTSASMLEDMKASVAGAITGKVAIRDFRSQFEGIIAKHGWTGWKGSSTQQGRSWRAKIVYETNIRSSYAAGRREQQQEVAKERPYLLYKHSDGVMDPRFVHEKWDEVLLPADHPWWRTRYPPNGYGCKCQAFALSESEIKRRRLRVTEKPYPGEADKGFRNAPGASLEIDEEEITKGLKPKTKNKVKGFWKKNNGRSKNKF